MRLEPIILSRYQSFKKSYELEAMEESKAFELFVNYSVLCMHFPGSFDADIDVLEATHVGGPLDMSIDGIAIKINGALYTNLVEIKHIQESGCALNVEFIFIQSKSGGNFNQGDLLKFTNGVSNFLSESSNLQMNDSLSQYFKFKEELLSEESMTLWDSNPKVTLYYVAMGKWNNDRNLTGIVDSFKYNLSKQNIYGDINVHFVDSPKLKDIYDSITNKFTMTLTTSEIMPLTEVENVSNSCIAIVYADEFLRLIKTEDGLIRSTLFDDNVRDFQGRNSVNEEIENTILVSPNEFIILNNGLTIVCESITQNNKKLNLKNPQIVNGCQTSNVIFSASSINAKLDTVPLFIKFISTTDENLLNKIVRGTNRQNIVLEEYFEVTKRFHKELEQFFKAVSGDYKELYYERRSKQYYRNTSIKQTEKFTFRTLIQNFVGMFLKSAHCSHNHEATLLKQFGSKVFQDGHSYWPYYTTAYSFHCLERLFRSERLDKSLKKYKAHLLMMLRQRVCGSSIDLYDQKKCEEQCKLLLGKLSNDEVLIAEFLSLDSIFNLAKSKWVNSMGKSQYHMKDQEEFTNLLLFESLSKDTICPTQCTQPPMDRNVGKVVKIRIDRNNMQYGFIARRPKDLFFHERDCPQLDFSQLQNKLVSYKISTSSYTNRECAVNVQLLYSNNEVE